jgi:adenylyltransferase/sulfurtransferase
MRFRELKLRRDPECPVCGDHPTVRELIDYEQFCGVPAGVTQPAAPGTGAATPGSDEISAMSTEITPKELKAAMDRGDHLIVVDVREPQEYQIARIAGSVLIPLGEIPQRHGEIDRTRTVVCQCRSGVRSAKAAAFLRSVGFERVLNLTGGILRWSDEVDPTQPKY